MLNGIGKAELAYYVQHKKFLGVDRTGYNPVLGVDARGGKYFNSFSAISVRDCRVFSQSHALWRRFGGAAALGNPKDEKGAGIEWRLKTKRLQ